MFSGHQPLHREFLRMLETHELTFAEFGVLVYMHQSADPNTGFYWGNARQISADASIRIEYVRAILQRLRRKRQVIYITDHNPGRRPYWLPGYFMLHGVQSCPWAVTRDRYADLSEQRRADKLDRLQARLQHRPWHKLPHSCSQPVSELWKDDERQLLTLLFYDSVFHTDLFIREAPHIQRLVPRTDRNTDRRTDSKYK